jgi:small-conductance mechanosensitive channel
MLITQLIMAQAEANSSDQAIPPTTQVEAMTVIWGLVIIFVTYWGEILLEKFLNWLSEQVHLKYRLPIKQSLPFCRAFLLGLAGVILIDLFLDLSDVNLIAVTGTFAVALGFAFKDYANSVIAGVIALFERPYQVGDRVTIGDHYGEIVSYGLRGILIRTPDDDMVTIPHNKMWTEAIVNANKGSVEAQTVINFYFGHEVNVDQVTQILYRVAQTSKYTQLKLPILVVMNNEPWGVDFKLRCYPIDARDEFVYKTDLIRRAKRIFAEYNFPYPRMRPPLNL